ncbi:MAG: sigma-70 family RNA polymerase sigma factor [Anaerolineae bacterium]|nr:sigma-70 family RNA polymerase sigma factor [Anaerolineae bacterium]
MATPAISDEQLVRRAQAGDREAFLMLYNRYLPKVFNRVKSRVNPADAEDVTQEIFGAVVRSLRSFDHRSRFNTWLYTIVNRQIADHYRRYYRRSEDKAVSLDADDGFDLPAEPQDLDRLVLVQQALQDLPEHYQEVVLLRFADGLSFAEIAAQRGQSLEATKSLFRRAIQAITDRMGDATHD